MLVSYSDSEDSGDEQRQHPATKSNSTSATAVSSSNFEIDKTTGKIKVNLQSKPDPSADGTHEDAPAAKRPRLGPSGGAFSGFNAMLPAPKRENLPAAQNGAGNASARKVFSLRTGAEPAFSRESDAELRELFAEENTKGRNGDVNGGTAIPSTIPKPAFAQPTTQAAPGKPIMFKPLSVARNSKKKKNPAAPTASSSQAAPVTASSIAVHKAPEAAQTTPLSPPKKQKINLFSSGADPTSSLPTRTHDGDEDEIIEDLGFAGPPADDLDPFATQNDTSTKQEPLHRPSQTLSSVAADLNLSAAERRQLFGRASSSAAANINIVNFNTDAEYAANQELIASGETIQHNPVRAIASGKHSLQQLLNSAATQKEALEESFAAGRRNKREAGSKYGW